MIILTEKITRAWHDLHTYCYGGCKGSFTKPRKPTSIIDFEWRHDNSKGHYNFTVWYEEQYAKLTRHDRVRLHRIDMSLPYRPDNCFLAPYAEVRHATTSTTKLNIEVVATLRRAARLKNFNIDTYVAILDVAKSTLYGAITGQTWNIVDYIEPPVDLKK